MLAENPARAVAIAAAALAPTPAIPRRRATAELRRATIGNVLAAIVATAEARPADDSTFASLIFDAMEHGGYHDAIADTVKRRGLERGKGEGPESALAAHARSLDARALRALVLELAIARGAYFAWSTSYAERLTAAASAYDIDIPTVEKKSAEEMAARQADRAVRRSKKRMAPAVA